MACFALETDVSWLRNGSGQSPASEGFHVRLQHVLAQAKARVHERLVVFVRGVEIVKQVHESCTVESIEFGFDVRPCGFRLQLMLGHVRLRSTIQTPVIAFNGTVKSEAGTLRKPIVPVTDSLDR